MKLQKRQFQLLIMLLICMLLYTTWITYEASRENDYEGIIRFHVIANSDSPKDQELKLKVRDALLRSINRDLVKETMAQEQYINPEEGVASMDINQSRAYIKRHLKQIETEAEKIIKEQGYDYSVDANLKTRWIPQKTYGDITFPAGNYEALNVVIGQGQGQNWWCVLFPPLCLIDAETQILDEKTKSDVLAASTTEEAIVLKSKTLEVLHKYQQQEEEKAEKPKREK